MIGLFQALLGDYLFRMGFTALLNVPCQLLLPGESQQQRQTSPLESNVIATAACFIVACSLASSIIFWTVKPLQFILTMAISLLATPVLLNLYLSNARG